MIIGGIANTKPARNLLILNVLLGVSHGGLDVYEGESIVLFVSNFVTCEEADNVRVPGKLNNLLVSSEQLSVPLRVVAVNG